MAANIAGNTVDFPFIKKIPHSLPAVGGGEEKSANIMLIFIYLGVSIYIYIWFLLPWLQLAPQNSGQTPLQCGQT
jgi:hypothetical protein